MIYLPYYIHRYKVNKHSVVAATKEVMIVNLGFIFAECVYACTIIEHLNKKAGTNYKPTTKETQKHIKARLNKGYTLDDFKAVIDRKCSEWLGTHMAEYLRPQTLFGTKFESYLTAPVSNNQKPAWKQPSEPEQPRDYSTNMMDLLDQYLGE